MCQLDFYVFYDTNWKLSGIFHMFLLKYKQNFLQGLQKKYKVCTTNVIVPGESSAF